MTVQASLPRRPLRVAFIASVAGNAAYAGGQWLALLLLARLTDPQTVGASIFALAVTAPLFLFSNLQLREVLATERGEGVPFATFLASRLVTTALALVAAVPLAFLLAPDALTRWVVALTALAKALDAGVDLFYGLWMREERQRLVALSLAWRGVTTVLIMAVALLTTRSLVVACVASAAQSGLMLLHAALLYRREHGSSARPNRLSRTDWARLGTLIPLGFAVAFDSLVVNVPRYVLRQEMGLAAVGAFGAIGTFMQLGGSTVAVGLAQVGIPRLARLFAARDRRGYSRLLGRLLAVGFALGAFGLVAALLNGPRMLRLALGPSYAAHATVLNWTMAGALVWYVGGILACGVTATRNFRVQLPVFGAAMAAVGLTSLLFVPIYGMVGAAVSILVGFSVRAIANALLVRQAIRSL